MEALELIDYQAQDSAERFVQSLTETGFGLLTNHPISESQVNSLYKKWQNFFDGTDKLDYQFDTEDQDGFFPMEMAESAKGQEIQDIKEYFHYYPWGRCPDELRADMAAYYQQTTDFACELLGWVERYSPAEVNYPESLSEGMRGSERSLLRVLHYPPLTGQEQGNAIRAAAHEDINLLTILPAANESGLQVLSKNGDWIEAHAPFNTLIINTGDMLQEASNGYFPSTTHRVVNPTSAEQNKSRLSLPLFLHPRSEVVLSERYTAGSYMKERLAELAGG